MKLRFRRKAAPVLNATEAVWFDAQSVRDLFWDVDSDDHPHAELADYVTYLSDADLRCIGQSAMADERLWDAYNEVLLDAIREARASEKVFREPWER